MNSRTLAIGYILIIWFVISFVTNIVGPLMPIVIEDFQLSLGLAGFLPFSFFLAYGLVSIPGGILVEKKGGKVTLTIAFALNLIGSLAIALEPKFISVIGGLFIIGLGMALLQVVVNPLLRVVGGEAQFAFFSVMAQLIFGVASFISPMAFQALMGHMSGPSQPLTWVFFYWIFSGIFFLLIGFNQLFPLPKIELNDDEKVSGLSSYFTLLSRSDVKLFFLAIVAYVGTEQTLSNWMSQFLSSYHHFSPTTAGADAVGEFWGLMAVGCLVGLGLLKVLDSKIVLVVFTSLAIVCITFALFGNASCSIVAFPLAGFFLSVMFSIIFSLALNSVTSFHGALSGILCTGILGGAVIPLLVGFLGDQIGLRLAMSITLLTLGFILSLSAWAKPLIKNKVVSVGYLLEKLKPKT